MSAAVYIRCASGDEANFEKQRAECLEYAEQAGIEIAQVYEDYAQSGLKLDRPGLQQFLNDAKAGKIDTVIMRNPSRLSRSRTRLTHLVEVLQKYQITIVVAGKGIVSYSSLRSVLNY